MVQQFAQNEQNMNAVERVLVYIELPLESDSQTTNDPQHHGHRRVGLNSRKPR
jgi:hypothetical protein